MAVASSNKLTLFRHNVFGADVILLERSHYVQCVLKLIRLFFLCAYCTALYVCALDITFQRKDIFFSRLLVQFTHVKKNFLKDMSVLNFR